MRSEFLDDSRTQKVLLVFIRQPGRYFSLRELSLRTGMGLSKVKFILGNFSRRRLLNHVEKKRQQYYQLNRSTPAFAELGKFLKPGRDIAAKDMFVKIIAVAGEIKFAALSGIFVGLPKAEVDLLLVGRILQRRLEKCLSFLQKISGNEINYTVFSETEYMERLYGSDWFLREILDKSPVIVIDEITKAAEKREVSRDVVRMMG